MTELALLEQTLAELFQRALAAGVGPDTLWEQLEQLGLTLAGVNEGSLVEAAAVVRIAGSFAAPVPLAETALLGGWLLFEAGLEVPHGRLTVASGGSLRLRRESPGWLLEGAAPHVPWGRNADFVVVLAESLVACVPGDAATVTPGENLAREPRDDLRFAKCRIGDGSVAPAPVDLEALRLRGALARSLALVGALERVLELTIRYATEREQFGRPLSHFQAIQQQIALQAAEVAAARSMVDAAVERPTTLRTACAKIRASDAAGTVARIAHQVHGAIGYTEEHRLHHFTSRLWSWRDEFGSEEEWAGVVGRLALANSTDDLWKLLTESGEPR